jgi:hypothetical protein
MDDNKIGPTRYMPPKPKDIAPTTLDSDRVQMLETLMLMREVMFVLSLSAMGVTHKRRHNLTGAAESQYEQAYDAFIDSDMTHDELFTELITAFANKALGMYGFDCSNTHHTAAFKNLLLGVGVEYCEHAEGWFEVSQSEYMEVDSYGELLVLLVPKLAQRLTALNKHEPQCAAAELGHAVPEIETDLDFLNITLQDA